MISVKDMNDNIHNACPRCGKDWLILQKKPVPDQPGWLPEHVFCSDSVNLESGSCDMMAVIDNYSTKKYFLCAQLDNEFSLDWDYKGCILHSSISDTNMKIVTLPFNITIERLKIILPFL